jgi:pimeloyl-ACP methyl ester carboxylesterase
MSSVLLLHSGGLTSRQWRKLEERLSPRHRVIAPDLLGYGESVAPAGHDVSMAAQAVLVPKLLDSLGVDRAVVVGHVLGGAVAQRMVVEAPERVAGLVLIDSVSFDSWPILRMRALRTFAPPFARRWPRAWFRYFELTMRPYVPRAAREPFRAGLAAWSRDRSGAEAFVRNTRAMDPRITQEIAPRLAEIRVPAHVVWGRRDPFQRVRWAARLRDAIPGATLAELDGGHFLPWEKPAKVAAEIRSLVART